MSYRLDFARNLLYGLWAEIPGGVQVNKDGMTAAREESPPRTVKYAGLTRRTAAAAIDFVLLFAASWLIVVASARAWAGHLTEMAADALEIHPGVFGQLFPISNGHNGWNGLRSSPGHFLDLRRRDGEFG